MNTTTRLSDALPKAALTTSAPSDETWALAALGYVAAIGTYLVALLLVNFANWDNGFRLQVQSLFDRDFLLIAPVTMTAVTLATRRGVPTTGTGRWRVDATLTGAVLLFAIVAAGSVIGGLAALGGFGDSVSGTFYDLLLRAAALILCGVGAKWALAELGTQRATPIQLPSGE